MKKFREYIWIIVLIILTVALSGLVVLLLNLSRTTVHKETIAGALFIDKVDDDGWNQRHYEGLASACKSRDIRLEIEENIEATYEAAEPAIERLIAKGCQVIFLTSDGYDKKLYPVALKHPEITFFTVSPDSEPVNMTTYYGRLYQARFLAGMLAGRMTKTNVLGFVAGVESCNANREINAFALGARSVNPKAVVKARFIGTWTDSETEKAIADKLIEEDGADLITYHASIHSAIDSAEQHGVYSIGFNNNNTDYSENYLGSVNCNWGNLYKTVIDDYFMGDTSPGKYYWHGVVFGTVELKLVSPLIPDSVKKEIDDRTIELINVKDVFYGDLYTNKGEKKCSKGERISDEALFRRMDWFVEGVEVHE